LYRLAVQQDKRAVRDPEKEAARHVAHTGPLKMTLRG